MIYRGANIFAIRYNSDGSLDTAFGSNGTAATPFTISVNKELITINRFPKTPKEISEKM
jgi:hypothetical protein